MKDCPGSLVTSHSHNAAGQIDPRDYSPIHNFRDRTVEQWNGTSQIMELPGTVRPAALWIVLLGLILCDCHSDSIETSNI